MKRFLTLLMAAIMVLLFTACGNNEEKATVTCRNCGETISKTASFCANCGSALANNPNNTKPSTPGTANTDTNTKGTIPFTGSTEGSTEPSTTTPPATTPPATTPPTTEAPHIHSYNPQVTTAATCTKNGTKTFTCNCGDTYTEEITATGHSYIATDINAATCTQNGYIKYSCSCGDSYTEETYASHSWQAATCTAPKTCSTCNTTEGDSLGHNIKNGTCSRCAYKVTVVLYEDPSVKITFKKAEKYKYDDDRVELYFYVENKTNRTLLIQADAVSLNGYSFCNLTMSDNVTAYSIGTVNLSVKDFDFNLININSIHSIGGQFRIIDDATWKSYNAIFTNVKLDGTGTGSKPTNFSNPNLLYSDNNCAIYYKSISKYPYSSDRAELYLYIENKTTKTLLIQADAISINGYSFANLTMSDPVLPKSIGIVNLSVKDFDFSLVNISNITKLGGQLRIIDDATWNSYNAIFTNIAIKQ